MKNVQELKKETSGLLVKQLSITRINNGNDDSEEMYLHKLSLVQKLFTTTDPGPSFIEKSSGVYTYKWYFQIKPTESYTINVRTNYTNLVVIIIALIVIILLVIYLRGSLTVGKRVLSVKKGNSIVETKVLISLKNRSRRRIKDIRVIDRLPRSMQAPYAYGSVMPVSSKKDEKGYLLVWNIKTMGPAEERVISYRVKANKPIQGMIMFPNVLVRYKAKNDRISTANSGSVSISSKL